MPPKKATKRQAKKTPAPPSNNPLPFTCRDDLEALTVAQLKAKLKTAKQDLQGNKDELLDRLDTWYTTELSNGRGPYFDNARPKRSQRKRKRPESAFRASDNWPDVSRKDKDRAAGYRKKLVKVIQVMRDNEHAGDPLYEAVMDDLCKAAEMLRKMRQPNAKIEDAE